MSWLVGPTGLSRLTTPSIDAIELALALGEDQRASLGEGGIDGAAGGAGMSAAPEDRGDGHRIGAGGGANADADLVRRPPP